jgi:hypothetical protein
MNAPVSQASPATLPAGFLAAPLSPADRGAALRLCAVIRKPADPAEGALVSLGERPGASHFLGCVLDAGQRVREWLEWSVQTVDFPGGSAALRETLGNAMLDDEWTRRALAFRDLTPELFLQTGWESAHPAPMLLDPNGGEPPEALASWELCRDEAALRAAGLPSYAASLHRYLWDRGAWFLPVSMDAPAPEAPANRPPKPLAELFAPAIPFNPGGGLLLARRFLPLDYEGFADALSGKAWAGPAQGRGIFPLGGAYEALRRIEEPEFAGGRLFSARRGKAGRLVESFHLKLHLLLDAAQSVRGLVAARKLPMLNLSGASFRVTLGEPATGLPFLWTAKTALVRSGVALTLTVPTAGEAVRYFMPHLGSENGPTLYRPAAFGRVASGRGTVRLRKLLTPPDADGAAVIEGTLVAEENLPEATSDLLCVRLRLGDSGRVTLFSHLETKDGLAIGEARFRTLPQKLPAPMVSALNAAMGAAFAGASFETLPMLGSPCDLYSLGVLAVRTLLVNDGNTVAAALDETLSLTRQAAAAPANPPPPLETRLETLMKEDPRWNEALGPQRLLRAAGTTPEAAFDLLPADLWRRALAAVLRCFPNAGPYSTCRDLGDSPAGAPEAVFDRLILDLTTLTDHTRSLVTLDWRQNREIRAAIRLGAAN